MLANKLNNYSQASGSIAMIVYAFMTALSSILIHASTQKMSPLLSACNTFLFCVVIYSIFSINTFKKLALIKAYAYPIFMLNVTTAICWIFTFLSLKYVPAELYLFTYLCAMPISATCIYRSNILKSVMLTVGLLFLIATYRMSDRLLLGVLLAFMGGFFGTIYSIYSKRITHVFATTEILSLRFYLTGIVTFILCILLNEWKVLSILDYSEFLALSFVVVIIPLTLFQIGLKNLSIVKALSFMPLAPLGCYAINFLLGNINFNLIQISVVFFLFIGMFL